MKQNKRLIWLLTGLIVISVVLTALPGSASAAPAETPACKTTHIISSGETLNTIAKNYDVLFKKLIQANNLNRPYTIYVLQPLCIPDTPQKYQSHVPYEAKLAAGDFTFQYTGKTLVVKTTNFPKRSTFYVKVGGFITPFTGKIGLFKTGKTGDVSKKFYLVRPWNNTPIQQVCLKDAHLNTLICRVINTYTPPDLDVQYE